MPEARRTLYPEIEPHHTTRLEVDPPHVLHVEESGNPRGRPVLFVHGGPGGGTEPKHRRYFDPEAWRIVLFDQRGCGRSTPHASLERNTTWDLVADMERIRETLGIERWTLFGGSWGSTLALSYAVRHPERVEALVLRGIFLLRRREIEWFYQDGASRLFPDAFEPYRAEIPEAERDDMLAAYHRRLTGDDPGTQLRAARAWSVWEGSTSRLVPDPELIAHTGEDRFALAFARIECHYFMNGGFLESDGWLLSQTGRLAGIPGTIVHGRYDVVCPLENAWDLHRAWPAADLRIVPDAGHAASEPGIVHELVSATDRLCQPRAGATGGLR